jgi:hypothetical protein
MLDISEEPSNFARELKILQMLYVTGSVDISLVVFVPLIIVGLISFIYLCSSGIQ